MKRKIYFMRYRRKKGKKKWGKIGEGKYFLRRRGKTEKEREENIWRSKHIFYRGAEKQRRKRRKIFGDDPSKNCQGY